MGVEKLEKIYHFRVTDPMHDQVSDGARQMGIRESDFLRMAIAWFLDFRRAAVAVETALWMDGKNGNASP